MISRQGGNSPSHAKTSFAVSAHRDEALVQAADLYHHEITPELYIDPGEYTTNVNLNGDLAELKIFGLCSETTTILPADDETVLIRQDGSVNILLRKKLL